MSAEGSPRQKMIGMMYLVLTALLALNVSKEIINAFVVINNGVETSNKAFESKNKDLMDMFKDQSAKDSKYAEGYTHALQVKTKSEELYNFIGKLKIILLATAEKLDTTVAIKENKLTLKDIEKLDDYDTPTNILIGSDPAVPRKDHYSASELKQKLNDYVDGIEKIATSDSIKVHLTINTEDLRSIENKEEKISWEAGQFYHTPVSASVALLSKIQSDIKGTESDVIKALFDKIGGKTYKISGWTPVVIADNVILQNSKSEAQIFLGALDKSQVPEVFVGATKESAASLDAKNALRVVDGSAIYDMPSGSLGIQKLKGIIRIKNPEGNGYNLYDFEKEFSVSPPTATVAATKMNVLYVGVENPLSISVPGVSSDKVQVSPSNCTLSSQGKGNYIAKVTSPGQIATISVSAEINGTKVNMGKQEFRVKAVPDPAPAMGKKHGSFLISKSELGAQSGIQAELENFAFDLKFDVLSFDVSAKVGDFIVTKSATGNRFTDDMKNVFGRLSKGSKIYIENVKARMSSGDQTVRTLGAMSITISGN